MVTKLKITQKDVTDFIDYVKSFYGKGECRADSFPARKHNGLEFPNYATDLEIRYAVAIYLQYVAFNKEQWGGGDTFDREIVRDIMFLNRGFGDFIEHSQRIELIIKHTIL